ncbi:MAG: LptF/LptG family permease, partial [Candidatus Adiutricales bacterium]
MKRIIPLYIIKEILPPFFVSLLVFNFIMILAKILELSELVIVKGVRLDTILRFLLYSLPFSLMVTIPLSTLLAVLLAFLRLTGDNEIAVIKSAGIGLYRLLPPVILFCLWTYL